MARCYLSSGRIAESENSSRNVRIRTNYGSLIDKFLAETAIPAEKRLNSKGGASRPEPQTDALRYGHVRTLRPLFGAVSFWSTLFLPPPNHAAGAPPSRSDQPLPQSAEAVRRRFGIVANSAGVKVPIQQRTI